MHLLLGFLLLALVFGWVNAIAVSLLIGVLYFMAVHPAIGVVIVVVLMLIKANVGKKKSKT